MSAITHAEACALLGVKRDAMRAMMADTPPDYKDRPWTNVGSPERPIYRWWPGPEERDLRRWAREVERWRTTKSEKAAGRSGGETRTGRTAGGRFPTSPAETDSSEKSSKPPLKVVGGSRSPADLRRLWNASENT